MNEEHAPLWQKFIKLFADLKLPPPPEDRNGYARSAAWSPNGKLLACGTFYGTVHLWDATRGELLHTLKDRAGKDHEFAVSSLAWSPDSKWLASSSYDCTVRVWEVTTPNTTSELLRTLEGHEGQVCSVAWSPDGKLLASGSSDKTIRLWDATTGVLRHTFKGHEDGVRSLTWSPDSKWIVSGSNDNTIRVWDVTKRELRHTLKGHTDYIRLVAWEPKGSRIASGSHDGTVKIWDPMEGVLLRTLESHKGQVCSVAWFPEGPLLASVSHDSNFNAEVRIWYTDTWELLTFRGRLKGYMHSAWHPFDPQLATVGRQDDHIIIWELDWQALRRVLKQQQQRFFCSDCAGELSKEDIYYQLARKSRPTICYECRKKRESQKRLAAPIALQSKIKAQEFDVFLCHNTQDKLAVREIAEQLKEHGILPWLDDWELRPGLPWQQKLEEQIEKVKTVAVFVGKNGTGPWQDLEVEAFLREFVKRGCPVIPVLLKDCPQKPALPRFLEGMTWVDFREHGPYPLKRLIWGITGEKYKDL